MINFIDDYYKFSAIFFGIAGTMLSYLCIHYVFSNCLSSLRSFIKVVFMYQYAIYDWGKNYLNNTGIIILELITTFSAWFLNVIIFVILGILYIIKMLCLGFYTIFKKRDKN